MKQTQNLGDGSPSPPTSPAPPRAGALCEALRGGPLRALFPVQEFGPLCVQLLLVLRIWFPAPVRIVALPVVRAAAAADSRLIRLSRSLKGHLYFGCLRLDLTVAAVDPDFALAVVPGSVLVVAADPVAAV